MKHDHVNEKHRRTPDIPTNSGGWALGLATVPRGMKKLPHGATRSPQTARTGYIGRRENAPRDNMGLRQSLAIPGGVVRHTTNSHLKHRFSPGKPRIALSCPSELPIPLRYTSSETSDPTMP